VCVVCVPVLNRAHANAIAPSTRLMRRMTDVQEKIATLPRASFMYLQVLCNCYAIVMQLLCNCYAVVVLLLCCRYTVAMLSLYCRCAVAVLSLCCRCAVAVLSLCYRYAVAMLYEMKRDVPVPHAHTQPSRHQHREVEQEDQLAYLGGFLEVLTYSI
jgi:hypothetical protein